MYVFVIPVSIRCINQNNHAEVKMFVKSVSKLAKNAYFIFGNWSNQKLKLFYLDWPVTFLDCLELQYCKIKVHVSIGVKPKSFYNATLSFTITAVTKIRHTFKILFEKVRLFTKSVIPILQKILEKP